MVSVSDIARNVNWGLASILSPLFLFHLLSSFLPSFSFSVFLFISLLFSSLFFLFPLLKSTISIFQLEGLKERCELPKRGLERNLNRNQIWCNTALEYETDGNNLNYFRSL